MRLSRGEKVAKAICTIADGRITGAYIIDEGSGYEVAPKVVVEGGGGSGCKLESVVADGKLKKIVVKQGRRVYWNADSKD